MLLSSSSSEDSLTFRGFPTEGVPYCRFARRIGSGYGVSGEISALPSVRLLGFNRSLCLKPLDILKEKSKKFGG
jgi:hypothetical protein